MKKLLILLLVGSGALVRAQTSAPAPTGQQTEIYSDNAHFDGNTRQLTYLGHVIVTDPRATLNCGLLTVDLPSSGGHPTNIVAMTKVVMDALDEKNETNHITCEKAVYTYTVANGVTNEIVTLSGSPQPQIVNPRGTTVADVIVWDCENKTYSWSGNYRFTANPNSSNGTNASPLDLFK